MNVIVLHDTTTRAAASSNRVPFTKKTTSTVFPFCPDASHWWEISFLVPHEPLRQVSACHPLRFRISCPLRNRLLPGQHLDTVVDLILRDTFVGASWQCLAFARFYLGDAKQGPKLGYYTFLHHHHHNEEEIFFPAIRAKAGTFQESLESDHVTLVQTMEDIKAMAESYVRRFAPKTAKDETLTAAEIDALRSTLVGFRDALRVHLADEERFTAEVFHAHFTEAEDKALVAKISAATSPAELVLTLALVYSAMTVWGSDEVQRKFLSGIPPPVVFLLRNFWLPAHQKAHAAVAADLRSTAGPAYRRPRGWFSWLSSAPESPVRSNKAAL